MECDRDEPIHCLKCVSYYRPSGYWFPFRDADSSFKKGTTLTKVWRRQALDRRLRLLDLRCSHHAEVHARRRGAAERLDGQTVRTARRLCRPDA
ncbi:MAG: Abi family protein [Coriobacteriia bacterium]